MPELRGTSGDDTLIGSDGADDISDTLGGEDIIRGLGGNDTLSVFRDYDASDQTVLMEGGEGNDLLIVNALNESLILLDGGVGNDRFQLITSGGGVGILTGAGIDLIDLAQYNYVLHSPIVVADFTPGDDGDRINWGGALNFFLLDWNGSNPFASGHMRLVQNGADVELWLDQDRAGTQVDAFVLIRFQNLSVASLTARNLGGFPPDGSGIIGTTVNGTVASDTLGGTNGNDFIRGFSGNDTLSGQDGDDRLEGGEGDDLLIGGRGDDIMLGDGGNDSLGDGEEHGGNDLLDGGDGNDSLNVSRGALSADIVRLVGGAGNDTIGASVGQFGQADISGGDGDDNVNVNLLGRYNISLGQGSDKLTVGAFLYDDIRIVVSDFSTGSNGDQIEWSSFLSRNLIQWNGFNPFQLGFARLLQSDGNVKLQFDLDGASGSNHTWITLITFENTSAASFNSYNLGYNPNTNPGQFLLGTNAAETLNGTSGDDVIQASGGDDVLNGGAGDDTLQGGQGRDVLAGGDGDDYLQGGGGGEQSATYVNGQYISGGDVADYRTATRGVTVDLRIQMTSQNTGQGRDTLDQIEDIFGSEFDDVLIGTNQVGELLMGFGGNDRLEGGNSDDILVGGDGDDRLDGGYGGDILDGGAGIDTAVFLGARSEYTIVNGSDGVTTIASSFPIVQTDTLRGVERLQFSDGFYNIDGTRMPDPGQGTPGADILMGTGGADTLNGMDGDDVITGGLGNDTINGGTGTDTAVFSGGLGSYSFSGGPNGSLVVSGADGTDTLTGIERVRFDDGTYVLATGHRYFEGGVGADTVTGTAGRDELQGLGGDDILNGLDGDDYLTGGAGSDTIDGGAGADMAIFAGSITNYTITSVAGGVSVAGVNGTDIVNNVERFRFDDGIFILASGYQYVEGSNNAETTLGSFRSDEIHALGGDDIIDAGDADDTIIGGLGNDTIDGGAGTDLAVFSGGLGSYAFSGGPNGSLIVTGADGSDTLINVERVQFSDGIYVLATGHRYFEGGGGADTVTGTAGRDELQGLGGDDILNGLDGDDYLTGGAGSDTIDGGAGADMAIFSGSITNYTITSVAGGVSVAGANGTDIVNNVERFRFDDGIFILASGYQYVEGSNNAETILGSFRSDEIHALGGDDTIDAGDADDTIIGGLGNDTIDGGAGTDLAVFSGLRSAYTITQSGGQTLVVGADGSDTLINVERLQFSDGIYDITGGPLAAPVFETQPLRPNDADKVETGPQVLPGALDDDFLPLKSETDSVGPQIQPGIFDDLGGQGGGAGNTGTAGAQGGFGSGLWSGGGDTSGWGGFDPFDLDLRRSIDDHADRLDHMRSAVVVTDPWA